MKKSFVILLMLASTLAFRKANAQYNGSSMSVTYMANGEFRAGHKNSRYADVDGHPYMFDFWFPGWATIANGKQYDKLILLYDEVTGQPNFKNSPNDSAMLFSPRATAFGFTALTADGKSLQINFKSGFAKADGLDGNTYYQVLTDGKMALLKRTVKTLNKQQASYGSNEINRTLEASDNYYLATDNKPVKVKNNNKAVLALMGTKAEQVKAFIDSKNLNVKNDNDFIEVVKYYNTL